MPPALSVIVGSTESQHSIAACLDALRESCADLDAEIIVVDAGQNAETARAASERKVSVVAMPPDTLTPRLWSEGLAISSGSVVAFTTGHCIVSRDWASGLLAAIAGGAAAAGGPLRLADNASMLDAAIFFLRYSAFLSGSPDGAVDEIAGDNSAYRRSAIPDESWTREGGFWEHDVNRAIRSNGATLYWVDMSIASFGSSFSFASICRHRFEHGRLFGLSRVMSHGESAVRILTRAPFVPHVLAFRAGRRAARHPEYRLKFVLALPLVLIIGMCWAAGEAAGALESRFADRR